MCGVRFPLPLLVAVMLGCSWSQVLAANAWDPGENGPEKVNRLDSGLDTPMKVTLYNPNPLPTKLFASCIVIHKAYVRFHELVFPAQDVTFTRYVPIAAQLALYSTSWRVVNNSSLKTSLACASYAEQNASAMMYQFNGTKCLVSTARMPMKMETCGDKTATAVFIRTSCPEPTAQVTLTPAPGAMNIAWTTNDPCHLAVKFKIDWLNVGGSNVTNVNSDVFNYRIYDRLGCEPQTVTVTALDSFSQPYGNPTAESNDTLPIGPPKVANLRTVSYVDHLDVTWSIADDGCLRINDFVFEWINTDTTYSGLQTLSKSTYDYSITGLHACLNITVSVKAHYDAGAGTTNVLSNSAETLPEDPVITTFVVDTTTHNSIAVSWTIQDYCKFIQDLKITIDGVTYDLDKNTRAYRLTGLACNTQYTFDLIPINENGVEFASRKSLTASTTNPDPVIQQMPAQPSYRQVNFQWTLTDVCNKASKVKIVVNGGPPVLQDDTNVHYTASPLPCNSPVSITVTPMAVGPIQVSVEATTITVGESKTISSTTATKDASFHLGVPWSWPPVTDTNLRITWAVVENDCDYITGYRITYGGGLTQIVSDKTATTATIPGYNACDKMPVTVEMLKGTSVMDSLVNARPAAMLSAGVVRLGCRKAVISWAANDICSSIDHYKVTYSGSEVITTDSTKSATITDQEQCQTLAVSIDGVDSNGRSAVAGGTISALPGTTPNCSATAFAEDICYGCLHYLTTLPKLNKAAAATKCTASGYKLYMPADAAEVADLIAFLVAELVPAADYADFRLYVDLTYASNTWTWGGAAAVDETSSSNWAGSHPDPIIGECAILSGGDGFKLKSVGCTTLQFAMCISLP